MVTVEEASRKVFEDKVKIFERATVNVFADLEDRRALTDMINEWRRLGPETLRKLSRDEPWNMPLYFALSAAILNRKEITRMSKKLDEANKD